jgi:hypothetical protein
MSEVKDKNLGLTETEPYSRRYVGKIITQSIINEVLSPLEQYNASHKLVDPIYGVQTASVTVDELLDRTVVDVELVATNEMSALNILCYAAIQAWEISGKDVEDLELVNAFLADKEKLERDRLEEPDLALTSYRFDREEFNCEELNEIFRVREIFYQMTDVLV